MIKDLQHLNSKILVNLSSLDPTKHKAYIVNTGIVTKQRLDVVSALIPQLNKNPSKVSKVEKRILEEINFGGGSNGSSGSRLGILIQQAQDELKKIDMKLSVR